uniref:Uncharacterized protein n=1 Tax=Rhizophora mucronata TaxID=61149 RepID=A0A2P2PU18_RHIMU
MLAIQLFCYKLVMDILKFKISSYGSLNCLWTY